VIEEESRPVTPNEYIAELPGVFHDLNFDSYPYLFQVIGISDDSIQLFVQKNFLRRLFFVAKKRF